MSRKPRIKILSNDHPGNWQQDMDRSRMFLCYVSTHALRDALLWEQLDYARRAHKPVRAFIEAGTPVPLGFFAGIDDCITHVVSCVEDVTALAIDYATQAMLEDE